MLYSQRYVFVSVCSDKLLNLTVPRPRNFSFGCIWSDCTRITLYQKHVELSPSYHRILKLYHKYLYSDGYQIFSNYDGSQITKVR